MGLFQDPVAGRSCWTCEYWSAQKEHNGYAICWHRYPQEFVIPHPQRGCSQWLRAIGSDDEPESSVPKI